MKIIGVDTSTRRGSVALLENFKVKDEIISDKSESFSRSILSMLEEIIGRNGALPEEIGAFGIALGPGSFTGIRIGLSTLIGIGESWKKPIFGVSSLEAMAWAISDETSEKKVCPIIDAGNGSIYCASFAVENQEVERTEPDALLPLPEALKKLEKEGLFFGEGVLEYERELKSSGVKMEKNLLKNSIAAGVAKASQMSINGGKSGDISLLKPNYIHEGPAARSS